jgi:hypothetical protein
MTVFFKTAQGSLYSLDHNRRVFYQLAPRERAGPLWNTPVVRIGERVEIWTADSSNAARVIQTDIVTSREVVLDHSSKEAAFI